MNPPKQTMCFREEEFLDKNFSVDRFVSRCKDHVTMATLREDLESHYKNIQLSLIELINQDYADFVSLSSNLTGTEKYIEHLNTPLGQLKEEIETIKRELSLVLSKIDERLTQRQQVRDKKSRLHHLINVVHCVEKIEKILQADPKSPDMEIFMNENRNEPGKFLERVAGEFNQLQFHVNQSKGHPIIESIRPRVSLITSKLQENLESTFEQGILSKNNDLVLRCLRTYALIDKTSYAEDLHRHLIVKPFVEDHINETYLNENDIETLCNILLEFVQEDCQIVINVSSPHEQKNGMLEQQKTNLIKGFDFLVNSIWIEIVEAFEEKLPLLFSPGDPDLFLKVHGRCTPTKMHLVFEALQAVKDFSVFVRPYMKPSRYKALKSFQEIGVKVEVAIETPFTKSPEKLFMTNVVGTIWNSIQLCWNEKVFIQQLTGRFWKLNLQLASRLASCIKEMTNVQEDAKQHIENYCLLLADAYYFIIKFKEEFKTSIQKFIKNSGIKSIDVYKEALEEVCEAISCSTNGLEKKVIDTLTKEGCSQLENVKNIPRLYRRTNKEPPSQPSGYIQAAFKLLNDFESSSSTLNVQKQKGILENAVNGMTARLALKQILKPYSLSVDDLLLSVKKTEDSLLRLKQQRKAAAGQANTVSTAKSNEISDENKIRMQVALDVGEYIKQVIMIGLKEESYPVLTKLKGDTQKFLETTTETRS